MGAGKSTIGKNIAYLFGCRYIDLDKYIENSYGKTVPMLFAEVGVEEFRKIEYRSLLRIVEDNTDDLVLSLGGGTVTDKDCADIVLNHTKCVYLKCSVGVLYKRLLKKHSSRPLLYGKTPCELEHYIIDTVAEREPFYMRCSSFVIDCDAKSIAMICDEVSSWRVSLPE